MASGHISTGCVGYSLVEEILMRSPKVNWKAFYILISMVLVGVLCIASELDQRSSTAFRDSPTIELDQGGIRGIVLFDHKAHETRVNPDPRYRYPAKSEATCAGCHHTVDQTGVIQLWKCASCHRNSGNPENPKNADFDALWSERAFHDQCIGCHQASKKGPITCGECHRSVTLRVIR